ncbi:HAMP domain-containing histidine kinase [Pontibacter sp. JH31]|uniref:histidine kinase n=1 Tax=Pontibacter aquaedesilientis TaxID=2766980 RepID=A0ABR7XF14_9BACT|nr:HAMP domain-containing sensor histidine kinase [Pontibacter aquaedesilientis]MBD1396511.1 HAMP domain-containing histidine kinase [Pontibacter aquaedesilientis]
METDKWIEQIGQQSKKAFFKYNLSHQHFEVLTDAVAAIWETALDQIRQHPEILLDPLAAEERDALDRHAKQVLAGTPVETTFRMEIGGKTKFVCCDVYPIRNEGGAVVAVAGVIEDITQQRRYQDYLTEFAQRKDSMLEMVSHDLSGPLAIVRSVAGLLREEVQNSTKQEVAKFTGIIEDACSNCTNLINDLLSEEHLRSPQVYVNKTRVDLVEAVRKITEPYQQGLLVSQQIELDLPPEPLVMELDQVKFSQILINLISNSIKFTHSDGRIQISVRREGDEMLLEHRDNGIGIPEHLLPHVFDRYTAAGRQGLKGEQSRGLGLSIVRNLVELQGGTIRVESREQGGTVFFLRLPLHG